MECKKSNTQRSGMLGVCGTLATPPHESHRDRDLERNLLPNCIELCWESTYSEYWSSRENAKLNYWLWKFSVFSQRHMTDPRAKEELELVFVWNRTPEKVLEDVKNGILPEHVFLKDLNEFGSRNAELIVEVAHAVITETMGPKFLETANYMVGSPTCFASQSLEKSIRDQLKSYKEANLPYGVFIPAGALWGANDIQKLADRGTLKGLSVTMKFSAMHCV